jgi:Bacterial PH domain
VERPDPAVPDEPAVPSYLRPATPGSSDGAGSTGPGPERGRAEPAAAPGPDLPAGPGSAAAVPAGAVGPAGAAWRVDGRLTGVRIGGTLIFTVAALALRYDPLGLVLSGLAGAVTLVYALRDLLVPVRLTADAEGLTVVAGFLRRERLPWDRIERVRVDSRRRFGAAAELLEIDAGGQLHLLGPYELGVRPGEAVTVLRAVRARGVNPAAPTS